MTHALIGRLFSTKTLVRIAFVALSLHSMGTAFAQGAPAGTRAPIYGSTWATAQAQSHNLTAQNVASEPLNAARAEAPVIGERSAHLSSHRTGG
jgi:hypothetical protein